jgi:two-component system chemotaxis sensor kinase CheA
MTDELGQWSVAEQAELKKVFFANAYEIVDNLQDALLAFEAAGTGEESLKVIKRHVHTLKGDSNTVGLTAVGNLCHRMEDVLSPLMGAGDSTGDAHGAVDLLLSCVDSIRALIKQSEAGESVGDDKAMTRRIERYLGKENSEASAAFPVLSEYQELQTEEAVHEGLRIFDAEILFHPGCGEKSVAARMALQRLDGMGRIILAAPDVESASIEAADRIAVVFATDRDRQTIHREAFITGITREIIVREHRCDIKTVNGGGLVDSSVRHADKTKHVTTEAKGGTPDTPAAAQQAPGEYLRIEASRVDRLMNLAGELIIGRSMVDQVARDMEAGAAAPHEAAARLRTVNAYLERTVSDIQKGVMMMRMVPVSQVFRKFPKMVRDLSTEKKKPIRLEISGKDTELDKRIVDSLGEPLAHIVRNMIDHGIEEPAERLSRGKPAEGLITLRAYHEASMIVIEASDDGGGINTEKLKKRAVEKGLLNQEEAVNMPADNAVHLIFLAGLSTADAVTDTSGRGVGMDVVKAAVESMRGTIEIHSTPGKGTAMRLRLPLTLAVIRALLFEAGDKLYALPVPVIANVTKVMTDSLATVNGRKTLLLRDRVISLISVQELFHPGPGSEGKKFVLVVEAGGRTVGLIVDGLMGQQELVIKAVDDLAMQSRLVAGASLLGNGKIVMILDVLAVVRKAVDGDRRSLASA